MVGGADAAGSGAAREARATSTAYRPEIDGLRALAVLPVIVFHAGLGLPGGYVGVDVFFVISGYLITSIIVSELERDTFSIAGFYERRARRILPALFLVIVCTVPFAWLWMLPDQFRSFSNSLTAVALFVSNVLFWAESGYFAPAAELKPLLHTWSLAVEEQFYVLFPLFLLAAFRLGRDLVAVLVLAILIASLALAEYGVDRSPSATFYLAPARAWELMLGALAALRGDVVRGVADRVADGLAAAGILAIVLAVLLLDEGSHVPGVDGLLPTGGTLLVILFARPGALTTRALSVPPLVGIGLVSYSAYLWHQPLFAFARLRLGPDATPLLFAALSGLSLLLAWGSWRFVEGPFRNRRRFTRVLVLRAAAVATVSLAALGLLLASIPEAAVARLKGYDEALLEQLARPDREHCGPLDFPAERLRPCALGDPAAPVDVVVLGDSQGRSLQAGLHPHLVEAGLGGAFLGTGSTLPLLGAIQHDERHELEAAEEYRRAYAWVAERRPRLVVLIARWDLSFETERLPGDPHTTPRYTVRSTEEPLDGPTSRAALEAGLANSLDALVASTDRVLLLSAIPTLPAHPRRCYLGARCVPLTSEAARERNARANRALARAAARYEQVTFVDLVEHLCPGEECHLLEGDVPLYRDPAHLTVDGARLVAGALLGSALPAARAGGEGS